MKEKPWKGWVPGVLSQKQIKALSKFKYIQNFINDKDSIDFSAFDLHLTDDVYQMKKGSIKPSKDKYSKYLDNAELAIKVKPSNNEFILKRKHTYVAKIKEQFNHFEQLKDAQIHGQATAKSTIGRVDVLARLIIDGMDEYDSLHPDCFDENISDGFMYLEISPITFNVKIKGNISLSQLRLFYGSPDDSIIHNSQLLYKTTLHHTNKDGTLSVDLDSVKIKNEDCIALSAKNIAEPLQLWGKNIYEADKFWKLEKWNSLSPQKRLIIKKNIFYILRSEEKISLPRSIAVYCKAMDEALGEMRIHYAGFVHPYFGFDRKDGIDGTPLIFEVRGHDVNVSLADNEKLAKLIFYRMSETVSPGQNPAGDYGKQTLKLSKIFKTF